MAESDESPTHRQFRGVTNRGGKWEARINHCGKRQSLGYFSTAEEAARAPKPGTKRGRTEDGANEESDSEEDGVTLATLQKNSKKGRKAGDADVAGKISGGKKSHKGGSKKRAAGVARPWTPVEDQLLCAIVHEFGSNWGLITDVFAASAPFKGVYRRAEQCRWRFQALTQSAEGDRDPNATAALNLNKGSARQTMARALPVEDDTARTQAPSPTSSSARRRRRRPAGARSRDGPIVVKSRSEPGK